MIAPDMATMLVLRLHRRADRRAGAAGAPRDGRRRQLQRDHRRQRHLDLGHAAPVRDRRGARRRAITDAARPAARRRSARRSTSCCSTSRSRWCGTARARASSSRCGSTARRRRRRRGGSRCRSPIRRWSRRRSPARTPTGAASSWRSARPASRPTATGWRSAFGDIRVAVEGRARPDLFGGGGVRLHEARTRSSSRSISASATARDRVWTCDLTKEYIAINGDYRS